MVVIAVILIMTFTHLTSSSYKRLKTKELYLVYLGTLDMFTRYNFFDIYVYMIYCLYWFVCHLHVILTCFATSVEVDDRSSRIRIAMIYLSSESLIFIVMFLDSCKRSVMLRGRHALDYTRFISYAYNTLVTSCWISLNASETRYLLRKGYAT